MLSFIKQERTLRTINLSWICIKLKLNNKVKHTFINKMLKQRFEIPESELVYANGL